MRQPWRFRFVTRKEKMFFSFAIRKKMANFATAQTYGGLTRRKHINLKFKNIYV